MTLLLEQFRPDPGAATPLYLQLVERIAAAVETGHLGFGQALPPERQLSGALDVSRVTLRKAIEVLTARGLIESRQGSGNFISKRVIQPLTKLSGFSDDMRARGWQPDQRLLSAGVHEADAEELAALRLQAGELVTRLVRLRLADGMPLALERASVPTRYLPSADAVGPSLYATLAADNVLPVRAVQYLRAAAAEPAEAAHLGIEVGSPVMHTVRQGFLADNRPVEFTRSVYRGDRYDFVAELR